MGRPRGAPLSERRSRADAPRDGPSKRAPRPATLGPVPKFKLNSAYTPTADQPKAIEELAEGVEAGEQFLTLLGATGTGKTFTMAGDDRGACSGPALVIAHNKTLAAQLCNEFREFFPDDAGRVLRLLLRLLPARGLRPGAGPLHREGLDGQRRDRPPAPRRDRGAVRPPRRDHRRLGLLHLRDRLAGALPRADGAVQGRGGDRARDAVPQADRDAVPAQRHDPHPRHLPGQGRGARDHPAYAESAYRIALFGDEVEAITHFDPLTGEVLDEVDHVSVWPATHYVTKEETIERSVERDPRRARGAPRASRSEGKQLEAHRLRQRTQYDLEMLKELGFCYGIENYSRILDDRPPGSPPHTLIDYFPDDFVVFIDESHQTMPQIGGMYEGDRSRKLTLVDHGFRLPSAIDNRPLKFDEFLERVGQVVMVSATPGEFERDEATRIVEQIVRPTGIVDPEVEVRETKNQIDDLMNEVQPPGRGERARPGHDADQEDVRGPDRVPARARLQGPLPALRGRHDRADPDHPRPAARRVRRARRRQPAARGPRHPRGLPRRDPRRRQGGLPARRDQPDPDDRPRRAQRRRPGADVRRPRDRRDAHGDRARPTAAARSSSPTTREHGITPETVQKGISDMSEFLAMESTAPAQAPPPKLADGDDRRARRSSRG